MQRMIGLQKIQALLPLTLFLLSACQSTRAPDNTRLRAIYDTLDEDHERLMARYREVSPQMSPEEQQLYSSLQQMHRQMMTGVERGMMGRGMMGRGMMGRGMMGMNSLREWDQQMMAMHGQMASMLRPRGFEDMAVMHEQMMQGYAQALDSTASIAGGLAAPPASEGNVASGEALFSQSCAACHGPRGRGIAGVFPPLAESAWVTGDKDVLIRITLNGLQGAIEVQGLEFDGLMPGFRARLSDDELAALITYIRGSWGNQAPAISAEDVHGVRQASQDRSRPWSPSELQAKPD